MRARLAGAMLFLGALCLGCGRQRPPELIILGLDAFNWRILTPLLAEGKMPVLARTMRNGWASVLLPEQGPIISPRLWTSIATGRTVQGHGIYDWQVYHRKYGRRSAGPADRTCPAFWNLLSDHGLSVGVVDWMATWPPEEMSGYMVSKLLYPPGGNTFPADLENKLWELRGEMDYDRLIPNDRSDRWARLRNRILLDAVRYLTRTHPVDVLAVMNYTPDPIQHKFWKYHEPSAFPDAAWWVDTPRDESLEGVVEHHYQWSDTLLQECLSLTGPRTVVVIVSDHGQEPCGEPLIRATREGVNKLLAELGYASVDTSGRAIKRQSVAWAEGVVGGRVGLVINPTMPNATPYVTLVQKALRALQVEETARALFSFVGPCSEIEYDRLKSWAVDLCAVPAVEPSDYVQDRTVALPNGFPVRDLVKLTTDNSGCHTSEGIIVLSGPRVRAGGSLEPSSTIDHNTPKQVDVLPTALYLLGFPLSRELEGRILWEALDRGLEQSRPPTYVDAYAYTPPTLRAETPASKEVTEKKLHALGYVQ